MKKLTLGLALLTGCAVQTEPNTGLDECIKRNLYDISDSVDNADNSECTFTYDLNNVLVECPSSLLDVQRGTRYNVSFIDENNDMRLNHHGLTLSCSYDSFETKDDTIIEEIQEEIRIELSFLPIPD